MSMIYKAWLKKRISTIVKKKDGYYVLSDSKDKSGHRKNLGGPYKTRDKAEERLRQVEFFKHKGQFNKKINDFTKEYLSNLLNVINNVYHSLRHRVGTVVTSKKLYDLGVIPKSLVFKMLNSLNNFWKTNNSSVVEVYNKRQNIINYLSYMANIQSEGDNNSVMLSSYYPQEDENILVNFKKEHRTFSYEDSFYDLFLKWEALKNYVKKDTIINNKNIENELRSKELQTFERLIDFINNLEQKYLSNDANGFLSFFEAILTEIDIIIEDVYNENKF